MNKSVIYTLFVLACLAVAVLVIWTLTDGHDVTLAALQAQKAEADARAEVARSETLRAKAALVEAEANAYVTRELGRVAARAVERQGAMMLWQQVVICGLAAAALVVNGLLWWSTR